MAGPGLPGSITAGVTEGHVTDHQKIHDLLNEFDTIDQASTKGDLLVVSGGTVKRLPVGTDNQVLTADSAETAGVVWGDASDADAIHDNVAGEIAAVTEKASPVSADLLLIEDSEAANAKKRVQVGNLPGGGGGASDLDGLTDVALTTPVLGEVLKFDGSNWVNDTDDVGSGSLPTPSAKGDIAVYDGSAWVVVSSGVNDQVLTADSAETAGVKWATPSGGGGGAPGWSPILDEKGTSDTPDDEFDNATLDAKWTAVAGSSGTVDLLQTDNVSIYDLATRPGYLLVQTKGANVRLRQDYSLPDGSSIVAALHGQHHHGGSNYQVGLGVSTGNTAWSDGGWSIAYEQDDANDSDIQSLTAATTGGNTWNSQSGMGRVYFRIARDGLDYHLFFSLDGISWIWLDVNTLGAAAAYLWLWVDGSSPSLANIAAFDWIRLGSNDFDPW